MWNQNYYYFDLTKIRVSWAHTTKIKLLSPYENLHDLYKILLLIFNISSRLNVLIECVLETKFISSLKYCLRLKIGLWKYVMLAIWNSHTFLHFCSRYAGTLEAQFLYHVIYFFRFFFTNPSIFLGQSV